MSISKIQSGDTVKVIAGNYKGIIGEVSKVVKTTLRNGIIKTRASVGTVPKIAKYKKSSNYQGQQYPGMKTETDRFIDVSNLSLLTTDSKLSKVKISMDSAGKKIRVLKKDNQVVSKTIISKPLKNEKLS